MSSGTVFLSPDYSAKPAQIVVHRCPGSVTVIQSGTQARVTVQSTGGRGPAGPPGTPGAIDSELPAVGAVPIYTVVSALNGVADLADVTDPASGCAVVGVALNSTTVAGEAVRFRAIGVIQDPAWSWVVNAPILVSETGQITQNDSVPVGAEWTKVVGHAISATSIFVNLEPTIFF